MKIIVYNNYGDLFVEANKKRYHFWNVTPFQYRRIEEMIKKGWHGKAWQRLKKYHQADFY